MIFIEKTWKSHDFWVITVMKNVWKIMKKSWKSHEIQLQKFRGNPVQMQSFWVSLNDFKKFPFFGSKTANLVTENVHF